MSKQPRVSVRVSNSENRLLNIVDLVPLVPPLQAVVEEIRRLGGISIDPARVAVAAHQFPVVEIEGWAIVCVLGCECTREKIETLWLQGARERSLRQAVASMSGERWRAIEELARTPALARAAFILTGIVETGILVARTGAIKRTINGIVFDGRFDATVEPASMAERRASGRARARSTVH